MDICLPPGTVAAGRVVSYIYGDASFMESVGQSFNKVILDG